MKRVTLDFNSFRLGSSSTSEDDIIYHAFDMDDDDENRTFTFDIGSLDTIAKIVVWANRYVNAIQVHMESGIISPMYGVPGDEALETEYFGGKDSQFVGIYGRYGGVMDSIGFRFWSSLTGESDEEEEEYGNALSIK